MSVDVKKSSIVGKCKFHSWTRKLLLSLVVVCNIPYTVAGEPAISFGVFPFFPPLRLEAQFRELVIDLSKFLDTSIQFRTRRNFDDFYQSLQQQEFDIALIQPIDYIALRGVSEYVPLVRKEAMLRGIFVGKMGGLGRLEDLRGKSVAFPSEQAAVTYLAKEKLLSIGLTPDDYKSNYYKDHASCLLALSNSSAETCVTAELISQQFSAARNVQYTVLGRTDAMPPILVVIGPALYAQKEKLQEWFLALNETPHGREILLKAYLEVVVPAFDEEYADTLISK